MNYLETVTTVATVFIAACALVATIVQGRQNRKHNSLSNERIEKHNRLSVKPFLITEEEHRIKGKMRHADFKVINNGIGPAVITNVILFSDNEIVADSNNEDFHKHYHNALAEKIQNFGNASGAAMSRGVSIAVGEKKVMWEFDFDPKTQNIENVNKLDFFIEYESMYGDKMPPIDTRSIDKVNYDEYP